MKQSSVCYRVLNGIYKAFLKINQALLWISAAMLLLLTVLIMIQVVMRFVFNSPIGSLEEWTVLLIIWSTSLGIVVCFIKNEHAKLDLVLRYCPQWVHVIMYVVCTIVVMIVGYVFVKGGIQSFTIQLKQTPQGLMLFSRAWYYALPMIVMGVLLFLSAIGKMLGYIATHDPRIMESGTEAEMLLEAGLLSPEDVAIKERKENERDG